MKMLVPTVTSYPSPIHGQSIKVVLCGQEHDGPTTVHEGDLFFDKDRFLPQRNC